MVGSIWPQCREWAVRRTQAKNLLARGPTRVPGGMIRVPGHFTPRSLPVDSRRSQVVESATSIGGVCVAGSPGPVQPNVSKRLRARVRMHPTPEGSGASKDVPNVCTGAPANARPSQPESSAQPLANGLLAHASVLRAYLRRRVRNPADVDDYVQEIYARVLASAPDLTVSNWRGFLQRAASNLLADSFRRGRTRMRDRHIPLEEAVNLLEGQPSVERILEGREDVQRLTQVLESVDPVARSVFLLVRVDGLTHREAAERLGLDAKQASRHVERVLARLARALAGDASA